MTQKNFIKQILEENQKELTRQKLIKGFLEERIKQKDTINPDGRPREQVKTIVEKNIQEIENLIDFLKKKL